MSSTAKRLIGASIAFVALLVAVLVAANRREAEFSAAAAEKDAEKLPAIETKSITELELRRPDGTTIVLDKKGDDWRLTKPLDAEARGSSVDMAVQKLGSLQDGDTGIVATRAANHEKLEVADKNGVQVTARAGKKELVHLYLGAYRGGSTMVRLAGDEKVHGVRGSFKADFNRSVDDWRDKRIVDASAADAREVQFQSDNGTFHFVKGDDHKWMPAEKKPAIDKFSPAKVGGLVSTLARLQAVGFADAGVTKEQAGIDESTPTATLTLQPSAEDADAGTPKAETVVLRLGKALPDGSRYYLTRDGKEPIYLVSKFLAERIAPKEDEFQQSEKKPEQAQAAPAPGQRPQLSQEQIKKLMEQMSHKALSGAH